MIFELRRDRNGGKWQALCLTGGCRDRLSAPEAIAALRAAWGRPLPAGAYRVRAVDERSHWRLGRVDRRGAFTESSE